MPGKKAGRGADQFILRLPEGMRDRIKVAAEENGRSMNAEVLAALYAHFSPSGARESVVIRLEALPPNAAPVDVSLGSFLQSFDAALKESAEASKRPLGEESYERASDGLQDPIEE